MAKYTWTKLGSKVVYKDNWIKVIKDKVVRPDGKKGVYAYLETNGPSVYVVALNDEDEVYLVGLYRYTSGEYSWELPAGNSDGENLLAAARRELREETGLVASYWKQVGYFWSMNGVVKEKSYVFIAKNLKNSINDEKEAEGIKEVKKVTLGKLITMIKNGEFTDGQSISAITKALLYLGQL